MQVAHNGMLNIGRKNIFLKKWLHHLLKIVFPLGAVWFYLVFVFVPGMQVRKLVYSSYQESVRVKIVVDRNAVTFPVVGWTIVAEFAIAVPGYLKLALKVIYPSADQGCSIRRQIFLQNFYFIQLIPF